ncbi:NAD(P)/FAD-dependent oxidoreductase [candidate division KSB1 bacterium]|nr:NAD(P)/FAD-dependent oxidoreductase [candidate division KSB1 bacterium]RQW02807.1 MAG: NAD(P)/FAD-dependent oxidoreductase [candidate division KSB1 bacterium]
MKNMIIIGAGIAGISTGCYARMNGYKTTIFEMHSIPGGLCTSWKRKGYTFDISMHMLTGSKSGPLHKMWVELGVVQDQTFHYHDDVARIESKGKSLTICTDRQRLQEQMIEHSSADADLINEFVRLINGRNMMGAMSLRPAEMTTIFDKLKMMAAILPLLGTFRKYGKQTIQEFAQRFKDPFLRHVVRFFIDSPGWPMLRFPMVALAGFMNSAVRQAGAPLGGSRHVVTRMADFYKQLDGEIVYKSRVKDVIVENDQAVGVRLEDGSEHRADIIVWAGDSHTVIFDILGGRYLDDEIRDMYDNWLPVRPLVHVAIGVNRDMSGEPHRIIFELAKPITIAGEEHGWMCFLHHCFDPSMAPPGKSAVEVWYATRYDYWQELARDRGRYEAEKKRIADFTIAELDKRWPGFASQVEVVDVPTPATYVHYTGNWQGSPDGWYITPENMMKQTVLRSLPGLSGFYMVGQWTLPFSGTVMAALSGRQLVQWLCKQSGKPFVTLER